MSKKSNRIEFIVRLNMNDPRHRTAWDKLQGRGDRSYGEVIVDALCPADGTPCDRNTIREIVREVLREEQPMMTITPAAPTVMQTVPASSIGTVDSAALDFMNSIGL